MTDNGLAWIGEHWYSGAIVKHGMLSDISLTAVRGVDPVDFVVRLGADRGMAERPAQFKDFDRLSVSPCDSVATFGRNGEWAYVLEVKRSTWHLVFLDRLGQDTLVEQGDELVCLDRFLYESPWVCCVDAAGEVSSGELGDSLLETAVPPGDRFGTFAALDAAMRRSGAVRDTFPGCEDPENPEDRTRSWRSGCSWRWASISGCRCRVGRSSWGCCPRCTCPRRCEPVVAGRRRAFSARRLL
ncbi:hypothetical protein [Streptomyces sp. NBC_01500]|uniref:hypothetical protein n=1 Tax=Streptomyces sp. NBC_01500 TaxID=2903886 RepID=UPI00224EA4D3|nr:hypothetical protein [Streptomyces sp. NBC_01500]MCX4551290.1 hypothetical protein [Streptomyces sp. NBC_01500]